MVPSGLTAQNGHPAVLSKPTGTDMTINRRRLLAHSGFAVLLGAASGRSFAQGAQPLENVKIITGFTPGGTSDTICRRVALKLQPAYGRNVVVENRSGAGGQLAIQAVKSMSNDGTVILQTPMSMLGIYPHIYKKLPYGPVGDLTPVSQGAIFDFGFGVGPAVPASIKSMPEPWHGARPTPTRPTSGRRRRAARLISSVLSRAKPRASNCGTCPIAAPSRPSWT
jgi:hypothetical protein